MILQMVILASAFVGGALASIGIDAMLTTIVVYCARLADRL